MLIANMVHYTHASSLMKHRCAIVYARKHDTLASTYVRAHRTFTDSHTLSRRYKAILPKSLQRKQLRLQRVTPDTQALVHALLRVQCVCICALRNTTRFSQWTLPFPLNLVDSSKGLEIFDRRQSTRRTDAPHSPRLFLPHLTHQYKFTFPIRCIIHIRY